MRQNNYNLDELYKNLYFFMRRMLYNQIEGDFVEGSHLNLNFIIDKLYLLYIKSEFYRRNDST